MGIWDKINIMKGHVQDVVNAVTSAVGDNIPPAIAKAQDVVNAVTSAVGDNIPPAIAKVQGAVDATARAAYETKKSIELMLGSIAPIPVYTTKIGCVVYCHLAVQAEHSGIYVGENSIVHFNGNGLIETVTPRLFLQRLGGLNPASKIFVSCNSEGSVGTTLVAERALSMIGKYRYYNLVMHNCHQFTISCLTGDFNNNSKFMMHLKNVARNTLGADKWREWKY